MDLYAEVLKWQKDMQAHRIYLTKNVLASNLEQIAQVNKIIVHLILYLIKFSIPIFKFPSIQISDSLQTLSSLIMHSKEDSSHLNDKLSSIVTEYNNLESCVQRENIDSP